jgi:hypothetical protein
VERVPVRGVQGSAAVLDSDIRALGILAQERSHVVQPLFIQKSSQVLWQRMISSPRCVPKSG